MNGDQHFIGATERESGPIRDGYECEKWLVDDIWCLSMQGLALGKGRAVSTI